VVGGHERRDGRVVAGHVVGDLLAAVLRRVEVVGAVGGDYAAQGVDEVGLAGDERR